MTVLLDLLKANRPLVMGILNVTPDSFSDGGRFISAGLVDKSRILADAEMMIQQGADIIDVGGESTRPGATPVSVDQELDRVIPVVEWLSATFDVPVSVDTSTPEVMGQAKAVGASMINDVRSFQRENALDVAVNLDVPLCIMHMAGEPQVMQQNPRYKNVVGEVKLFLEKRISQCLEAGVKPGNIIIDPGFGFGKTLEQNLALVRGLPELAVLGYPLLIGVSRKTMIGNIVNKPVDQRMFGSAAMALLAVQRGARIVRVHDVAATVDALKILESVERNRNDG